MFFCLIWTMLLAAWMPFYFIHFHKELYEGQKALLVVTWCISVLTAVVICVKETDMTRIIALTALAFILSIIAIVDYEKNIIPNHLQVYLIGVGIIEYIVLFFSQREDFMYRILGYLLTGFGFFAVLLLVALLSKGFGGGDVKLIGLIGCLCGYMMTVSILFWALVSSMIVSVVLLVKKKKEKKDTIPFGPFLLIGYFISMAARYR